MNKSAVINHIQFLESAAAAETNQKRKERLLTKAFVLMAKHW